MFVDFSLDGSLLISDPVFSTNLSETILEAAESLGFKVINDSLSAKTGEAF